MNHFLGGGKGNFGLTDSGASTVCYPTDDRLNPISLTEIEVYLALIPPELE
jgi:hypothetical protein